jgi:hypothetical protein
MPATLSRWEVNMDGSEPAEPTHDAEEEVGQEVEQWEDAESVVESDDDDDDDDDDVGDQAEAKQGQSSRAACLEESSTHVSTSALAAADGDDGGPVRLVPGATGSLRCSSSGAGGYGSELGGGMMVPANAAGEGLEASEALRECAAAAAASASDPTPLWRQGWGREGKDAGGEETEGRWCDAGSGGGGEAGGGGARTTRSHTFCPDTPLLSATDSIEAEEEEEEGGGGGGGGVLGFKNDPER